MPVYSCLLTRACPVTTWSTSLRSTVFWLKVTDKYYSARMASVSFRFTKSKASTPTIKRTSSSPSSVTDSSLKRTTMRASTSSLIRTSSSLPSTSSSSPLPLARSFQMSVARATPASSYRSFKPAATTCSSTRTSASPTCSLATSTTLTCSST